MSSRKAKTKIVNGEIVTVDENASSQSLLSSRTIDLFGFNLELRQFLVLLAIILFFLGPRGSEFACARSVLWRGVVSQSIPISSVVLTFFRVIVHPKAIALLLALGAYFVFNRVTSESIHPPCSVSISGGGGSGRRQSGSNIRGIKDLPCDPKVG